MQTGADATCFEVSFSSPSSFSVNCFIELLNIFISIFTDKPSRVRTSISEVSKNTENA